MDEQNSISIQGPTNINLNVQPTTTNTVEEKSTFERAIIEAFKQNNSIECMKKLSIAYDEVKFLVDDVKASQGKKFILNKNLLDKLSRLTERKFFNVNILIAKIYENLLETTNFGILSNDLNLLISFSNELLNILEIVKSTNVSRSLEKKCSCFLNYLLKNSDLKLEDEQRETIEELLNSFPTRNSSDSYKNFQTNKEGIINLCKTNSIESKMEGILTLMEAFGNTYSLEEQFDLLLEYCPMIIKAVIHQPNPENKKVYFQLGNFIVSMLYSFKFKVSALISSNQNGQNNQNGPSKTKTFFLMDPPKEQSIIMENNYNDLAFLHDSLYELTTQKDILLKCENLFSICNLIVNTLSIYETIFDLQYVCYLVLKKIYFTFPQFRKQIEDLISLTLVNLCSFVSPVERANTVECRQFLHFLLNNGEESLKEKLQHRIESKKNIDTSLEKNVPIDLVDVEYDVLNFASFNLRVGYPNYYQVDAGSQFDRYIEIEHPNSLVYIGFATHEYDITCHLLKYVQGEVMQDTSKNIDDELTDKGHFVEIFKLEKIDCSEIPVKIVILVKTPGIYKLIFDNSYSWITAKTIRHRLSVLKPLTEIDYNKAPVMRTDEVKTIKIEDIGKEEPQSIEMKETSEKEEEKKKDDDETIQINIK